MVVPNTLYEQTVKFGFAKLLSVNNFSNAAYVGFPLPAAYDSFIIELDNLFASDLTAILQCQLSRDNGASWLTNYWWSGIHLYTNYAAVVTYSSVLDADALDQQRINVSRNDQQGHPLSGIMRVFCVPGDIEHITWEAGHWGTYPVTVRGAGFVTAGGRSTNMLFFYRPGNITGTIRVYGLKTGA